MTCGLGYQLMISQLSFKLQHNFNRNEAGQIVSILIFEGKQFQPHFWNKGELKGALHFVKIFRNFGSVENGKHFVGSSHWKIQEKVENLKR